MFEGRDRAAWSRTALLASILVNAHRDPKKRRQPITPDQLNPYTAGERRVQGVALHQGTLALFAIALSTSSPR